VTALLVLLHLGGAVALLLWATRMVRTGVERAYGHILKARLRHTLRNPLYAVGFGGLMAIALQSSTAVVLLISSFVSSGFVSAAGGLMAVRGGELGSALLTKILILDLNALVPILLIFGTFIFLTTKRREWRQFGRICIGVALLLLSLEMTRDATMPLRESAVLPAIIAYLSDDLISSFLLAALLTYLFHSSIAGIILIASFAHHELINHHLALVMVLGVNFGSSVIAPLLTRHASPRMRIVPLGNLLMRGAGSVLMLIFMGFYPLSFAFLGETPSDLVVNGHIVFNLMIMLFGIILARPVLLVTGKFVALTSSPTQYENHSFHHSLPPTALDREALEKPVLALQSAKREIIRMSDIVDMMLAKVSALYESPSQEGIEQITEIAKILDKRQGEFTLYLTQLSRSKPGSDFLTQIKTQLDASIKLQQVGYIISHSMLDVVKLMANGKLVFSQEDKTALLGFCHRIIANARMAFYLLVASDLTTAQQLVREKDSLREAEQLLRHHHFERLRKGKTSYGDKASDGRASTLYLDLLNDLKQVNALLTATAYPILEGQGLLKETRLEASEPHE